MASEYTEQDRANEGCCWDWVRQLCRGGDCLCDCHATTEQILLADRSKWRREATRLQALLAERDAEVARLQEAGQAYIDAYDAALKAPLQCAPAEEYCHAQRYSLRAALAARGGDRHT